MKCCSADPGSRAEGAILFRLREIRPSHANDLRLSVAGVYLTAFAVGAHGMTAEQVAAVEPSRRLLRNRRPPFSREVKAVRRADLLPPLKTGGAAKRRHWGGFNNFRPSRLTIRLRNTFRRGNNSRKMRENIFLRQMKLTIIAKTLHRCFHSPTLIRPPTYPPPLNWP